MTSEGQFTGTQTLKCAWPQLFCMASLSCILHSFKTITMWITAPSFLPPQVGASGFALRPLFLLFSCAPASFPPVTLVFLSITAVLSIVVFKLPQTWLIKPCFSNPNTNSFPCSSHKQCLRWSCTSHKQLQCEVLVFCFSLLPGCCDK